VHEKLLASFFASHISSEEIDCSFRRGGSTGMYHGDSTGVNAAPSGAGLVGQIVQPKHAVGSAAVR
jgi:hypothetical protein